MAQIGTDIAEAAALLNRDALVAIPTETVYGLAANALRATAVTQIFKVKNRPHFDPLIVHLHSTETMQQYVTEVPQAAHVLFEAFSPGPLTILLPKKAIIPDIVTSGLPKVGIRIPAHPITRALLGSLKFPLAAPSANPFGYISPTTAQHVEAQLGGQIPYILDGEPCTVGVESTIVGFEGSEPIIYRTGGITVEAIEQVLDQKVHVLQSNSRPEAPGMLDAHYAPSKKLLLGNINELIRTHSDQNVAILTFMNQLPYPNVFCLTKTGNLDEAAQNLFGMLRFLDEQPVTLILAEPVPNIGLGRAINDRLKRASFNKPTL